MLVYNYISVVVKYNKNTSNDCYNPSKYTKTKYNVMETLLTSWKHFYKWWRSGKNGGCRAGPRHFALYHNHDPHAKARSWFAPSFVPCVRFIPKLPIVP